MMTKSFISKASKGFLRTIIGQTLTLFTAGSVYTSTELDRNISNQTQTVSCRYVSSNSQISLNIYNILGKLSLVSWPIPERQRRPLTNVCL